jgi:hypothetical protein
MSARKATPSRARARRRTSAAPALPAEGWDAPLHELARDSLSVFLYLALMPEETVELVRELGLSQPGFRQEALGDVQRCDLLADEIRSAPERRAAVIAMLRKGWDRPVLATWPLAPEPAVDLLDASAGEGALALALWRVLCDPAEETRAEAAPFLARLAEHYYGPPTESARTTTTAEEPAQRLERERDALARKLQDAEQKLQRAEERAEAARKKGEDAREKLQSWLKEARAREAHATEEAARSRALADQAVQERVRTETELAALRAQDVAVEAQRLRGTVRDLEARASSLESRLARARDREAELTADLARVRADLTAAPPPVLPDRAGTTTSDLDETEETPATWLTPVYTREFYDSLDGWDRRVQRSAFKQAALLAQDHRHPSLRALPLEGLPGYYRVRVATDVRLIYRRTERQNTIEILSLIDREDLDRYIKQAKTRSI